MRKSRNQPRRSQWESVVSFEHEDPIRKTKVVSVRVDKDMVLSLKSKGINLSTTIRNFLSELDEQNVK